MILNFNRRGKIENKKQKRKMKYEEKKREEKKEKRLRHIREFLLFLVLQWLPVQGLVLGISTRTPFTLLLRTRVPISTINQREDWYV